MVKNVDLIIIGGGVGGLYTALASTQLGLSCVVIEQAMIGGKLFQYDTIHHHPTLKHTKSTDYAYRLMEDVTKEGIEVVYGTIDSFDVLVEGVQVTVNESTYQGQFLVLAVGTKDKHLTIPNADVFLGQGVSYCAACDGSFFKGKDVMVIANDPLAYEETIHLAHLVHSVTLALLPTAPLMDEKTKATIAHLSNVVIMDHMTPVSIQGEGQLESITFIHEGLKKTLPVSAVFPILGSQGATSWLSDLCEKDQDHFILVDDHMKTSLPRVYAVGDVVSNAVKSLTEAKLKAKILVDHLVDQCK